MDRDDRFEIEQLIYRYALTFDAGDAEGFADVFADDGIGEATMLGESEPFSRICGRAEFIAFVMSSRADGRPPALHHPSGVVFDELADTSARTRSMVLVTRQSPSGPAVVTHGVYHDEWRKSEKGWRLQHRRYVAYGYRPQPQEDEVSPTAPSVNAQN